MVPFLFTAVAAYAALAIATLLIERSFFSVFASNGPAITVGLTVLALPALTTWLTAELVDAAFHKRLFDSRAPRTAPAAAAGIATGLLGVLLSALMLVLLDRTFPDALLFAAAAAASTAIVLTPLPRRRAHTCPRCAYDLSGASPASGGACTECGYMMMDADPTTAVRAAARSVP
jgi:hypothetical protein